MFHIFIWDILKHFIQVAQEKLLQYIHFNRHYNTLLIEHNTKLIDQLKLENIPLIQNNKDQIEELRRNTTLLIQSNAHLMNQLRADNKRQIDNLKNENALLNLIQHNAKLIDQLSTVVDTLIPGEINIINYPVSVF